MQKSSYKISKKRAIGLISGIILISFGVSLFKLSRMGNDPYSAMIMSVSALLNISYATLLILFNTGFFVIEIIFGRKYIGIGTFAHWFVIGYIIEFFIWLTSTYFIVPESFLGRLPLTVAGVVVICLGVSIYQTSNAGIAPYDSISLIMHERTPAIPYFWCRMICDRTCTLICLLTGGLIGLGTFLSAFCLGPLIHFFNIKVSQKILCEETVLD